VAYWLFRIIVLLVEYDGIPFRTRKSQVFLRSFAIITHANFAQFHTSRSCRLPLYPMFSNVASSSHFPLDSSQILSIKLLKNTIPFRPPDVHVTHTRKHFFFFQFALNQNKNYGPSRAIFSKDREHLIEIAQ
jgi:hypothetical protein